MNQILYLIMIWIPVKSSLLRKLKNFINVFAIGDQGTVVVTCKGSDGILDNYSLMDGEKFTHFMLIPPLTTN